MPLKLESAAKGVAIYDRQDRYICTVFDGQDKEPVALSKVSKNMVKAILAAEDHNFYKHAGLDGTAIGRAILHNVQAGRIVEGASTITQQLARSLYLNANDRSFGRKFYEAYLALQIEARYPKEKILEQYLNEVYFGKGSFGIERAASNFFNKHASQLTIGEAAFLAGVVRSPSILSDPRHLKEAVSRRNVVLDAMSEEGFISTGEAEKWKATTPSFVHGSHRLRYPHYVSHVIAELQKELGDDLWRKGYKAYTNLDPAVQQAAEKTLNTGLRTAPRGINQGALVSMKLEDGAVLAMVGGVGAYDANQWNRATHPHTAGSSFKPFVYLSGLLSGVISQDTLVADTPLVIKTPYAKDYAPRNFDGGFYGWMPVRQALAWSRNVCAIRVALAAGLDRVVNTARSAGLITKMDAYPSLALGACAVSPLQMTEAYGTIARAGVHIKPQFIRKIANLNGETVKTFYAEPSRNFPQEETARLVDALRDVVDHGTGTRARLPGIQAAGKTGTADKGKDIWFVGFTPEYVTAVWAGNDSHKAVPGARVTGGQIMAGLWKQYMTKLYSIHKPDRTLALASPQIPLIKSIPLYSDEALLGYSGVDSRGSLLKLDYNVQPVGQASFINVDSEISADGLASAVAVQKVAAERRREIAEMQRYEEYRSALERGENTTATSLTPTALPETLKESTARAATGSLITPVAPRPAPAMPQGAPRPAQSAPAQALPQPAPARSTTEDRMNRATVAPPPGNQVAGGLPKPKHWIEQDPSNQVRNPGADIKKEEKKNDDDKEESDDDKSDEVASLHLNQYRRHLASQRIRSPYVQEYDNPTDRNHYHQHSAVSSNASEEVPDGFTLTAPAPQFDD